MHTVKVCMYAMALYACKHACLLSVYSDLGCSHGPLCTHAGGPSWGDLIYAVQLQLGVMIFLYVGYCDSSVREKDWRCRQRGTQAT